MHCTNIAFEMRLPEGQRSTTYVARLAAVVSALNNEVTQMTGKKPTEAIKEKAVSAKPRWKGFLVTIKRQDCF